MEARFVLKDCCFAEVSAPKGMDALMMQLKFGGGAGNSAKQIL